MTKRTLGVALTTVAVVAALPAVGSAVTTTTTTPRITVLEDFSFVPNRSFTDKMRFNKDLYNLRAGVTIQIRNRSEEEPHSISVVAKSQLPKTVRQLGGCYGPTGICSKFFGDHAFPEGEGPPANPVVNKGAAGLDTRGDSVYFGPGSASIKLSASKGKSLYFMCIIHPQMQAKISVK